MPVNQVAMDSYPSFDKQLQNQKKYSGEDLGSCGKAKAKSLKLVRLPIQGYVNE